ncbi:unnamed protein product [Heligmosomoides polygyrus]|uniref:Ovule protein n=1 Tax=Heligmosomoides polygyrus TaxID=6339 RepID=A0A183FCH3_HELPZ|nr:unnamed protein product [Heligmosomoides polygyrus]
MANTYWQRRELKIIKTCANSSCKCDAGFNLVDFRQKKEYVYKEMRTTLQPIWVDMGQQHIQTIGSDLSAYTVATPS